jgi:hypothetical protein
MVTPGLKREDTSVGVHGGKSFFKEETKMRKIKWVIIQYIFVVFSLVLLIRLVYFADKLRRQGIDDTPVVLFWFSISFSFSILPPVYLKNE